MFGNLYSLKISLSLFISQQLPTNIWKKIVFQQAMSLKSGAKTKVRGSRGEMLAKLHNETTAVAQKVQQNYRHIACKAIFSSLSEASR